MTDPPSSPNLDFSLIQVPIACPTHRHNGTLVLQRASRDAWQCPFCAKNDSAVTAKDICHGCGRPLAFEPVSGLCSSCRFERWSNSLPRPE